MKLPSSAGLLAFVVLFVSTSCSKKGSGDPAPPPPPEKKYNLSGIRDSFDNHETYRQILYNSDKKPVKVQIFRDAVLQPDSFVFEYNSQKQLIKNTTYSNSAVYEYRFYYYNASGQLTGDTGYNASMVRTQFWNFLYHYDCQVYCVELFS